MSSAKSYDSPGVLKLGGFGIHLTWSLVPSYVKARMSMGRFEAHDTVTNNHTPTDF